ncbi:General secretion pathway protein E [hydrothermal vent metagenome]|uniref:protein-secreting ATPase n=1 Tax=hydrothermal vent metagenome TaxID=652676 RepID=A0A3B0UR70_9ZZZZ
MTTKTFKLPSYGFARKRGGTIEKWDNDTAVLALSEKAATTTIDELQRFVGDMVTANIYSETAYKTLIQKLYGQQQALSDNVIDFDNQPGLAEIADDLGEPDDLLESNDDAPIIRLINAMLSDAVKLNASDIHIEPFESIVSVRYRIDGSLQEVIAPPKAIAPLISSRIKIMSKLDISEKRLPQDGRISIKIAGRSVDVRVSTIPGAFGERIVMRLLDKQAGQLDLTRLGMNDNDLQQMQKLVNLPHGIVLVTGPTGSGKTTTLYAAIETINDRSRNIMTVEDPVEYYLDGISQTQINPKIDMTFAKALRAILRQDPDVIMIGEIRDLETAEIAVQASLTGHLVLSTLHTNTAAGAITRLVDMGVPPFLLASSVKAVLAQRLVRMLNPATKIAYQPDVEECKLFNIEPQTLFKADDSLQIQDAYSGRMGIYELIKVDEEMKTLIHQGASEQQLEKLARKYSISIRADGVSKMCEGLTTADEILRVT